MVKKISFELKSGVTSIAKGTFIANLSKTETEESFMKRLLEIEMAVNENTNQRLHLFEVK